MVKRSNIYFRENLLHKMYPKRNWKSELHREFSE